MLQALPERRSRAKLLPPVLLLIAVVLLLLFSATASSAGETPRGLLWKVTGDDRELLIAGSIHLRKRFSAPSLPSAYLAALRDSSCLVLETDPAALAGAEFRALVSRHGYLPPSTDLERDLGSPTWQKLARRFELLGIDPENFRPAKPWLAVLLLTRFELEDLGYRPEWGLDRSFHRLALDEGKDLVFLETPAEQLEHLASMKPEVAREMLDRLLAEPRELEATAGRLSAAWEVGSVQALEKQVAEGYARYPEFQGRILTERNRRWAGTIRDLLGQGRDCLVLVGSAHLVGPGSLLEQLSAMGLQVERCHEDPLAPQERMSPR